MLKNIDRVLVVLIVAAVGAGSQAEARDGVPFEIAAPRVGPAPGDRMHMKVAASNDQFLAVWADQRDWNDVRVFATRVSADGTPLDGIGLRIANAREFAASAPNQDNYEQWPGITPIAAASDGTDFVVISRVGGVVRSSLVTADGKHAENKAPLPSAYSAALLWTGTEYMLIYVPRSRSYGDVQAVIRYVLIDRSGIQRAAPRDLVTTASYVSGVAASTSDRSSLMVAWADASDGRVHVMSASIDQLRRGTFPTALAGYGAGPGTPRATDVAIASDGQRYLCVWGEEETPPKYQHTVHSRWLGADGVPLSAEVIHGEIQNVLSPSVVFDGSSFLVAFGTNAQLMVVRVRDGIYEPASNTPVDYGSYSPTFGVAANQRASLLFWKSTASQMVAAPLPLPIVGPSPPGTVISLGNAQRSSVQAVWRGDHYLASWTETGGNSTAVYGRFDANGKAMDGAGVPLSYAGGGGLASDGDNALIVGSGPGITATLVDRLGHATTTKIFDRSAVNDLPVVTWNGQEYVALWLDVPVTYTWRTMAARIGRKGELIAPPSAIGTDSLSGLNFIFPIESGYYAAVQSQTGFCFPACQPPMTLWIAFLSPDLKLIGKSEVLSVPAGTEYYDDHWASAPAFAKRGKDAIVVWGQNDSCCRDALIRGARISGTGLVLDRPQGFAIGKGTHVRGVVATSDGFDVVGSASAWSVSADARSITPTSAYAFVPADQSSHAYDVPNPYAQLVPGGPRPLIIYQHPSDDEHDIPYYVGAFAPPARLRAVRP